MLFAAARFAGDAQRDPGVKQTQRLGMDRFLYRRHGNPRRLMRLLARLVAAVIAGLHRRGMLARTMVKQRLPRHVADACGRQAKLLHRPTVCADQYIIVKGHHHFVAGVVRRVET